MNNKVDEYENIYIFMTRKEMGENLKASSKTVIKIFKELEDAKLIKQIDEITEEINKKYIKLRYKFIPYLYDMMHKCEKSGAPIIRPLLYNYQNDKW